MEFTYPTKEPNYTSYYIALMGVQVAYNIFSYLYGAATKVSEAVEPAFSQVLMLNEPNITAPRAIGGVERSIVPALREPSKSSFTHEFFESMGTCGSAGAGAEVAADTFSWGTKIALAGAALFALKYLVDKVWNRSSSGVVVNNNNSNVVNLKINIVGEGTRKVSKGEDGTISIFLKGKPNERFKKVVLRVIEQNRKKKESVLSAFKSEGMKREVRAVRLSCKRAQRHTRPPN